LLEKCEAWKRKANVNAELHTISMRTRSVGKSILPVRRLDRNLIFVTCLQSARLHRFRKSYLENIFFENFNIL